MSLDRFFKEDKGVPNPISLEGTFIPVDNGSWRKPYVISVERLGNAIQLKIDEEAFVYVHHLRLPMMKKHI